MTVLYYQFTLYRSTRHEYTGLWWYVDVVRIGVPGIDDDVVLQREIAHTRWGALRLARRAAKNDLQEIRRNNTKHEVVVWRPKKG